MKTGINTVFYYVSFLSSLANTLKVPTFQLHTAFWCPFHTQEQLEVTYKYCLTSTRDIVTSFPLIKSLLHNSQATEIQTVSRRDKPAA
jgi:hypothetical protein